MTHEERVNLIDLMDKALNKLKENQDPFFVCINMFEDLNKLIDKDLIETWTQLATEAQNIVSSLPTQDSCKNASTSSQVP